MGSLTQGFRNLKQTAGDNLVSTSGLYQGQHSALVFRCDTCKRDFVTTAFLYKKSEDGKRCLKCKKKVRTGTQELRDEFVRRCKEKNGDYYDYSLVPVNFKITNNSKIQIICPEHGVVEVIAHEHMKHGVGCGHCKGTRISEAKRKPQQQFIDQANAKHEFKYNYSLVKYQNARTKVKILCPIHGMFEQTPDTHLRGSGCSVCHTTSKAVKSILNLLDKQGIVYETEKTFPGCKVEKLLRFDIYMPKYNLCIEYDGIQHTMPVQFGNQTKEEALKAYKGALERDYAKEKFCEENNIGLIRIPYTTKNPDSFLLNIIGNYRTSRYIYTYEQYSKDVERIVNHIRSFGYEEFCVYGVVRGGLVPAAHLSNIFECPLGAVKYQRYDASDTRVELQIQHSQRDIPIFVVDDLISSGITMCKVVSFLKNKFRKAKVHPIVLFGFPNDDGITYINEHPKQWIVMPWESK